MSLKLFQKGFNYSQDGQGNRLVYHLQGCQLHCPWCANPEGMAPEGVLFTEKEWLCRELCPFGAVKESTETDGYELDRTVCAACQNKECLTTKQKGIHMSFVEQTVEDMVDEVMRSTPMFYDGGGVTFTGGEATLQFEPLKELLLRLKKAGIHTAVETNGVHQRLPELFPYIDQLIMDLKHWNEEKHRAYTGSSLTPILKNLQNAIEEHGQADIRIPLVGGFNDSAEDMQEFIKLFQTLTEGQNSSQVTFEILKYHEFGKNKWPACGLTYRMTDQARVTVEQIREFKKLIQANGFTYKRS